MAEDYYATLNVSRTASSDEIQQAYRKLVRQYHPDMNPDDDTAKDKFQEVQKAFEVLNDPQKRDMYDRYGSAYEQMGQGGAGPQTWSTGGAGPNVDINLEDLFGSAGLGGGGFADIFKGFGQRGKRTAPRSTPTKGAHLEQELTVPFTTAVLGGEAQIAVRRNDGQVETIQVKIPAGIESGKKIRLRGQGQSSQNGGPSGDILIKVLVAPHPHFRRQGKRLDVRVPITLAEAISGAKIDVPTPHGSISLSIPAGTTSGSKLRIKGHGVKPASGEAGDLFAEVMVDIPKDLSDEDRDQILKVTEKYNSNPRSDLLW